MTKYEFDKTLKRGIKSLPDVEVKKALDYYTELFEDKAERGESETEIIAEFGSPAEIADKLVTEFGGDKKSKERHLSGSRLALFIIFTIFIGFALFGVAIGLWATLLGLGISGGACILVGILGIIPSVVEQIATPAVMWTQIGLCVACVGVGILLTLATIFLVKLGIFLTKKTLVLCKNWLYVK